MKKMKKLLTAALLLGALASCGETPTESTKPSTQESAQPSTPEARAERGSGILRADPAAGLPHARLRHVLGNGVL